MAVLEFPPDKRSVEMSDKHWGPNMTKSTYDVYENTTFLKYIFCVINFFFDTSGPRRWVTSRSAADYALLKLPEFNVDYFKSFFFLSWLHIPLCKWLNLSGCLQIRIFIRSLLANHYCHIVTSINQVILMFIPRFSLNSHVRTESLYGMKSLFFFFLLCGKQKKKKKIWVKNELM